MMKKTHYEYAQDHPKHAGFKTTSGIATADNFLSLLKLNVSQKYECFRCPECKAFYIEERAVNALVLWKQGYADLTFEEFVEKMG